MDTVTLTIDGRQVTVAKGRSVLQAAIEAGIKVPYYCYHPALGVDGSCRVCLVKIEKMPKLQVSCSVTAADGMVVHTATQEVEDARAGVFEFLLLNHPLDCPVCDKGGECPLQDFSYAFGRDDSRMEFPRRTFDGDGVKADVDFGPTLMLNRNRCILCTRCVRFMQDIDGDAQIGIMNRGNGSEIATFEEHGVHSLLSGNLMDVCPVGAITTRDYRFKSRPWDNPSAVDTICTLCEKGCSTTMWLRAKPEWAKGAQLVRVTPRLNEAVNGYWMCDIGRFDYHWIESDARLTQPMVRGAGGLAPTPWDTAIAAAAKALQAGAAARRARASCSRRTPSHEELYVAARIAQHLLGDAAPNAVDVTWTSSAKPQPAGAKFVVPTVNAPNVGGARLLGLTSAAPGEARRVARRPARRRRGRQGVGPVRPRSRTGRLARRRRVDRGGAEQGHAEDADRAGRDRDGAQRGRRRRAVGRLLGGEGSLLHQRPGHPADHVEGDSASGLRGRGHGRPAQARRRARRRPDDEDRRRRPRRPRHDGRPRCPASPASTRSRSPR